MLRPILRPAPEEAPPLNEDEGDDPEDDLSPRAVALRALKEIEFDRATGKLSEADYHLLERQYTAEALAALRASDAHAPVDRRPSEPVTPAPSAPRPAPRPASGACSTHGPRPEAAAVFCSECGARLGHAPGYCSRCGAPLEREARYCHTCGARVAA